LTFLRATRTLASRNRVDRSPDRELRGVQPGNRSPSGIPSVPHWCGGRSDKGYSYELSNLICRSAQHRSFAGGQTCQSHCNETLSDKVLATNGACRLTVNLPSCTRRPLRNRS
jgi:hypothetical protein